MRDKFVEFGCEFLNESTCEEVVEEEGYNLKELEGKHFEEEE